MKKKDIDYFFKAASKRVQIPAKIYLTGGIASWFMGGKRPTQDIDFALQCEKQWEETARVLRETSEGLKIAIQFSEDISRWGMIGYSNFRKGARLYKNFGKISVFLLDPIIWSVGKITRYTADDIKDMEAVFKKMKVKPENLVKLWAQALLESPRSSAQSLFVKKVRDFLENSGLKIWGKKFEPKHFFDIFMKILSVEAKKEAT